jgi:twitching motility protein PilT
MAAEKGVDRLLMHLVSDDVSDIHFKVGSPPILRKNGIIIRADSIGSLQSEHGDQLADEMMTDAQKTRFHEGGEIDLAHSLPGKARFRVNIYRQRGSISVAMRHVHTSIPTFEDLHLPDIIQQMSLEPRGLILVTGTTGSGKTTTLAAMIDHINRYLRRHIITVEDPIEVLHADSRSVVNQREIGIDTESYAAALKYVLRQDPDVILIGEMRDPETVSAALTAAQTGHLVMSTLHTIDATETINRIIDFFPLHEQKQVRIMLAGTLKGIISQRLLVTASGEGRVPAVEIMIATNRIRDFILDADQAHMIHDAIAEGDYYGMQTFDQSLLKLYEQGMISLSDAAQVAKNPHDFKLLVQQQGHDVSLMPY